MQGNRLFRFCDEYRRQENINTQNIFEFTGHEWDEDTQLLYAKARYYDPDTARFLSQDPFEGHLNTPPSLHKYLYAYQNPTVFIDPDGREACLGRPLSECVDPIYFGDGEAIPQITAPEVLGGEAQMTEMAKEAVYNHMQNYASGGRKFSSNRKQSIYTKNFELIPTYNDKKETMFYAAIPSEDVNGPMAITYIVPPGDLDNFVANETVHAALWSLSHIDPESELSAIELAWSRGASAGLHGDKETFNSEMGNVLSKVPTQEWVLETAVNFALEYPLVRGGRFVPESATRTSNGSYWAEGDFGPLVKTVEPDPLTIPNLESGQQYAKSVTEGGTGRALAGHGTYIDGTAIVPSGTSVTLPRPNISILDKTGRMIENGDWIGLANAAKRSERIADDIQGMATWLPGSEVPNYILTKPSGLNIYSKSVTTSKPAYLEEILQSDMGCVDWAACTVNYFKD